ncbi:hypothetical protein C8R46DRAFT_1087574 [Mycena filopes]|nr:hypothetical protein C8R46DRAFT_1087574 [Mycena filopes]
MDPLSILSAVLSSSIAIYRWIDELKSKETAIADLKSSLSSITLVLHPLREKVRAAGALDSQVGVLACVQNLGECLDRAREHLQTWQESESRKASSIPRRILAFLDPSQVLDMIKEDRTQLNHNITILTLAIQLAWAPAGPQTTPRTTPLDLIANPEVKAFWLQRIGTHTPCCPNTTFAAALSAWLGGISIPNNLFLQLDEYGFGGVTPSSFDRFVGAQSISGAIARFTHSASPAIAPQVVERLIVWVADNLQDCRSSIEYAESLGIRVISFSSLAAVKTWIGLNEDLILATAASHRLRFISDSARNEGGIFNPTAGELLLRYIRGRGLLSPVLIFASSVDATSYVGAYQRAGSTSDVRVVREYIKALAEGVRDVEWVGFNARWGMVPAPPSTPSLGSEQHQLFIRPTILYVTGTQPNLDQGNIDFISSLGIMVVSFLTTDELKQYMDANQDHLRRTAIAHRLRFITQNVRLRGAEVDLHAGEETLKYVRAQGFNSPVLVLCTSSIVTTRFVTLHYRAGSTTDAQVVRGYAEALASGVRDTEWVGFDRKL